MPTRRSVLAISSLALALVCVAEPIKRIAQPAISPDGKEIAFSWQGDIWLVGINGGEARRLTVHPALDNSPIWTPDGKSIIFSSNRFGATNVFSMHRDGTGIKRLTFDGGSQIATSVSPDGKYVYGTTLSFAPRLNLYRVPIQGGNMTRLTMDTMESSTYARVSPDGSQIYYIRGSYGTGGWQKPSVFSSAMPNVWVASNTVPLSNQHPLKRNLEAVLFPNLPKDGQLYTVSNRSGWPNVYASNADGSGAHRLTNLSDGTISALNVCANGKVAVYVFESELYRLDLGTGTSTKLEIEAPEDLRGNNPQDINLTSGAVRYAVAPDDKRIALEMRGDIFLIPEKGGTTRRLTTNPRLDTDADWLDPKTMVYVAVGDHSKRAIKTLALDGSAKNLVSDAEDNIRPVPSPDGKWVAYLHDYSEVRVIGTSSGAKSSLIVKGSFRERDDAPFSWSPDGKYLVVDKPTDRASSEVWVYEAATGKPVGVVARTARGTSSTPRFLPNGKGIYFTANEYPSEEDLFLVDLVQQEPTFTEDDLDKIDEPKKRPSAGGAPEKPEIKIAFDFSGIDNRMRRLTRGRVGSNAVASADGRSIYVVADDILVSIPTGTGPTMPVAGAPSGINGLSLAGGKLYFVSAGKLGSLALGGPAAGPANIPFNASYTIDPRVEEAALFDDVWWAIDRFYYDPKHNGLDWTAMREKYAKVVPYVQDRQDFYALMGEMMEELNSSHLGSTAPPAQLYGSDETASLGVDFDPRAVDARGSFVVTRVLSGSCASNPASKLEFGDRLVAVDGDEIGPKLLPTLLNKKAGKKVVLTVDRGGKTVMVTMRPDSAAARRQQEYFNWIAWERKETERLSGGQLTYLHVEAMNDPSYEKFLREIRTLTPGKKGVLIDVRYNGGGSTSHKLLSVLIKRPWLIRTTRGFDGLSLSENIYRGDSLELPSALLANSYSFSNAEVMAQGFRSLKVGPIIGEETPGYVIGTGAYGLFDGGAVRLPQIGAYAVGGENLENHGRKPDIAVPYDPDAWASGRDMQLEAAVKALLKLVR